METKRFSPTIEDELVDEGEYEVTLYAEPKTYGENNDRRKLLCKFVIRDDVEQPFKGSKVSDDVFPDKDDINWKGWFDHKKLHKILLTQENPVLDHTSEGIIQYINGLDMRIKVDKKYDDFRAKTINSVHYLSYEKTKFPRKKKENTSETSDKIDIDDSQLPF